MPATLPALLSLFAAACMGLTLVLTQFGLRHMSPAAGPAVSIPTTAAALLLLSPFFLTIDGWTIGAVIIFGIVGLFYPAAATRLTFEANVRLGPTVTATISSTTPLFAVIGAVLLLGEIPPLTRGIAILVIVSGVALISWQPNDGTPRQDKKILLLPLCVAILRGLAQPLTKFGFVFWPNPFAAALISYSVSAIAIGATLPRRARINAAGARWFAMIGLINGSAMVALNYALSVGSVSVVAPIFATFPLFAMLFSLFFLKTERLHPRLIAGAIITVAGVSALLAF
jgi:drug/metabolite transporter (DMT)-like permease